MKVFIDFDDVIFNTKEFRSNLESLFDKQNITRDVFQKYYADPNDRRAIKTFNPWLQIERMSKELSFDADALTAAIDDFISDISMYVFSDVEDFANSFGYENIYVVSYGDLDFQQRKINGSKVVVYLKNITVTDSLKSIAMENIINKEGWDNNEKIFFLDDRIEQIRDIKEKFPEIITILIKRPEGRYQEMQKEACCDFESHDLIEAGRIIKEINKVME